MLTVRRKKLYGMCFFCTRPKRKKEQTFVTCRLIFIQPTDADKQQVVLSSDVKLEQCRWNKKWIVGFNLWLNFLLAAMTSIRRFQPSLDRCSSQNCFRSTDLCGLLWTVPSSSAHRITGLWLGQTKRCHPLLTLVFRVIVINSWQHAASSVRRVWCCVFLPVASLCG